MIAEFLLKNGWAITLVISGFLWWALNVHFKGRFTEKKDFTELKQQTDEIEKDVDIIKSELPYLVKKQDLTDLKTEISEVKILAKSTNDGFKRLETFFIEKGVNKDE